MAETATSDLLDKALDTLCRSQASLRRAVTLAQNRGVRRVTLFCLVR
jgi:hypothetical protein